MTGIDDQNPLQTKLENELNSSEWLQKFKAINQLLHSLKAEIETMQHCELKWDTSCNGLTIHCPSAEIVEQFQQQQAVIVGIADYANNIVLVAPDGSQVLLKSL
ncbi:MAG: hypothetical protein AAF821_26345 [Cyanobacteria bacterium P01_D01_bin.156]